MDKAFYSIIAASYNELHGKEQLEKARILKSNLGLRGLLLDVGAGTGKATMEFEDRAECVALDPCIEMLRQYNGLRVVARAEQLPFRDSVFDCVVSITALHHACLGKAFSEIKRVLKENGCVGVSFFKRAKRFGKAKALFKGFRRIDSEKDTIFVKG